MANLRVNKIAAVGVSTENTGAVYFDGTGDWLRARGGDNFNDFNFGSSDFTIEGFFYANDVNGTDIPIALAADTVSANSDAGWYIRYQSNKIQGQSFSSSNNIGITTSGTVSNNTWYHVAYVREGSTFTLYVDGVAVDTATSSSSLNWNSGWKVEIGSGYGGANYFAGYISNLRICKGHAVYKSNFAVPVRELDVHPGPDNDRTVLLACYDGENIFAEKTGRHILASQGNRTSSPTLAAGETPVGITTFNPGLTRNVDATAGPTFQGGVGFASQNWLTLPKGTTTERNIGGNTRGLIGGGFTTPTQQTQIDLINIATTGNAVSFGDLDNAANNASACSSSTRGLWAGGTPQRNTITFVTIATLGNSVNFGELDTDVAGAAAVSNSTRGIWGGGNINPGTPVVNNIQFVTIATQGSATAFGTLTEPRGAASAVQSTTRGVYLGGRDTGTPDHMNEIDYITISTTGDATDFGDLATSNRFGADSGVSSHVRGVVAGGEIPATTNLIEYITIASTGNSNDFGDLSVARKCVSGTSNKVRGTFSGGENPGQLNAIEYIIIQSMGNAIEFGDMTTSRTQTGSCSDGHGGLP